MLIVQLMALGGVTTTMGLMITVNAFATPVAPSESVAAMVKLNEPTAVGVPLKTPPVDNARPVGSVPDVVANVIAPVPPVDASA